MRVAIWWIRRDLRLADNPALTAALAMADQVIPLFILDPHLAQAPTTGAKRLAFLLDGLRSLDADLARRGSRLIFRQGDPQAVLADLVAAAGAGAIVAQADVSPYARRRDAAVAAHPRRHRFPLRCRDQSGRLALHRLHALQPGLEGAAAQPDPAARARPHSHSR